MTDEKQAEKNPRELCCGVCGKKVKVGWYICRDDNYTCDKCRKEAKKNAANDKGNSGETAGAIQ